ncbi:MAG TPA: helix-turn-helix domain-containing protein [Marmoricola sp.]|nr:helix-turn-helix domain-containing protein [Marmoricola sp.]
MTTYGQFCPVAKAMELLDERWTLLVVRELILGSRHFNDLRRGVPRMSPALLSKRLRTLTNAGVVVRRQDGGRVVYELTEAGRELYDVIEALGRWGVRWIPQLGDQDLDPHLLMWDIHRNLDVAAMPDGRTVLEFRFPEVRGSGGRWWIVVGSDGVDLCDADPGHDVTVSVTTSLRTLTCLWRGDIGWKDAAAKGLAVDGPSWARAALPRWLRLSVFAPVPRPAELVTSGS